MSRPIHLLLIGDSDSQLLACEALCRFPQDQEIKITINAIPKEGTPDNILTRAAALGRLWQFKIGQVFSHPELKNFDAIGVFLTGSKIAEFRNALNLLPYQKRPLLFCGFNGVVLEKFNEGLSWRLGYDLLCLNGPRDQEALDRLIRKTPYENQPIALTGLKRNDVATITPQAERPKEMVFTEQVVMPKSNSDRARMVRILAQLAQRSPNWNILIKPRIAPNETTFHAFTDHIRYTIDQTLGHAPTNLRIDYSPLPELLQRARIMATVSSTAFFDALDFGCRPVVMADFGINQSNGSHVFAGCGVWCRLEDIEDLDQLDQNLEAPSQTWLDWMGYSEACRPANLISTLEACLERRLDTPASEHQKPIPAGYLINSSLSFTQLRRNAEAAIDERNYEEAKSLLRLATLLRPTHRNVARRLRAVQCNNRPLRKLLLTVTYRDVG